MPSLTSESLTSTFRDATRAERRALLAGNAARTGQVPATTHPRVLRRMREAGWVVGTVVTDAGRRAALTPAQRKALTAAARNGGRLVGLPHATAEALVRIALAVRIDAKGRVTAERGGTLVATAAGLRAVTPTTPSAAPDAAAPDPAAPAAATPTAPALAPVAAGPAAATSVPAEPLSDQDRAILDLERTTWTSPGAKERRIREGALGMSPTRYYQYVNALLDDPRALAHDPGTVHRLRRIRDERRARRARCA